MKGSAWHLEGGWIGATPILVFFKLSLTQKVNSLDMQLRWIYLYDKLATKHDIKTVNKDRGNRSQSTRRHGCNPEFLPFRGVRLVGEVWTNTMVQRPQRPHPLLRWTAPQRFGSLQLSETFEAESGAFTTTIWGTTHKGLGAPKQLQSVTKTSK